MIKGKKINRHLLDLASNFNKENQGLEKNIKSKSLNAV
jgi:hypothetical protein